MYYGRTKNNQDTSEEKNEGRFALLDIKTSYKTTVIKTAWFGARINLQIE